VGINMWTKRLLSLKKEEIHSEVHEIFAERKYSLRFRIRGVFKKEVLFSVWNLYKEEFVVVVFYFFVSLFLYISTLLELFLPNLLWL
jgi:hypothetical protein